MLLTILFNTYLKCRRNIFSPAYIESLIKVKYYRMKNIFFFIIVIILSSCKRTNQEKEIIIENRIINPVVHRVEVKQLLNVDKIGVYDTTIVFINRGTDSIFYMYDSSDFTYKGAYGVIGNGPEDFQFPFF